MLVMLLLAPGSAFLYRVPARVPTMQQQQQRVTASAFWMSESSNGEEVPPEAAAPADAAEETPASAPSPPPSPPLSPMAKMRQRTEQGIVDESDGIKIKPENVLPPPEGQRSIAIFLVFVAAFAAALSDRVAQAGM